MKTRLQQYKNTLAYVRERVRRAALTQTVAGHLADLLRPEWTMNCEPQYNLVTIESLTADAYEFAAQTRRFATALNKEPDLAGDLAATRAYLMATFVIFPAWNKIRYNGRYDCVTVQIKAGAADNCEFELVTQKPLKRYEARGYCAEVLKAHYVNKRKPEPVQFHGHR